MGDVPTRWRPLLVEGAADAAWSAVIDVATDLRREISGREITGRGINQPIDLASGSTGLALFFAYLAEARGGSNDSKAALACLEHAVDAMATQHLHPGLFSGYTGVAWTVKHLTGRLLEADAWQSVEPVDEALEELLDVPRWHGDYDLISGLVGFAAYALEGLPRPAARRCLELAVTRLAEMASLDSDGLSWFTPPQRLSSYHREMCPLGCFNYGVAHGMPGVISVFSAAHAAGVLPRRSRSLLEGTVGWLLAHEQADDVGSCFPNWSGEDLLPRKSRLAWCYGDLGLCVALLVAGRRAGRHDWQRGALRIARRSASRSLEDSGVLDASLCHGAAGVGHLFNRLYQATGDETLAAAARCWFDRTLALHRPGEGVGGFLFGGKEKEAGREKGEGERLWRVRPGFLDGSAGVAIALLGALSDVPPEWDRVLLATVPGGGSPVVSSGCH